MSWSLAINPDVLLACDAILPNVDKEHYDKALRASVCMGSHWELCFEWEL